MLRCSVLLYVWHKRNTISLHLVPNMVMLEHISLYLCPLPWISFRTCLNVSLRVLCVVVCQRWRFPKTLLDAPTMASLYVFHVPWSLDVCQCVFCLCTCRCVCSLFNKKVPLCSNNTPTSVMLQGRRQDGANQGWCVYRRRASQNIHMSFKGSGSQKGMLLWLPCAG